MTAPELKEYNERGDNKKQEHGKKYTYQKNIWKYSLHYVI